MREIVTDSLERSFFGPRFQLASDAEQRYLAAMADLGEPPYRSSEVATRYGAKDTRGVSVFRESLIQKGLIWSPEIGLQARRIPRGEPGGVLRKGSGKGLSCRSSAGCGVRVRALRRRRGAPGSWSAPR